ncbi:MAG: hypothetical protein WBB82_15465 [Limnothrix sp.]
MTVTAKVSRWAIAIVTAGSLVSCNAWSVLSQQDSVPLLAQKRNISVTAIASLNSANPGSNVHIKGVVAQNAPFIEGGAYEIQDQTGTIWVITNAPLPAAGTEVLISGELNFHDLRLGANDFGEVFVTEIAALDPGTTVNTQPITAPTVVVETIEKPIEKPKLNLDPYLFPHKEQSKIKNQG